MRNVAAPKFLQHALIVPAICYLVVVFIVVICEAISIAVACIEIAIIIASVVISIIVADIAVAIVVSFAGNVLHEENVTFPAYLKARLAVIARWCRAT